MFFRVLHVVLVLGVFVFYGCFCFLTSFCFGCLVHFVCPRVWEERVLWVLVPPTWWLTNPLELLCLQSSLWSSRLQALRALFVRVFRVHFSAMSHASDLRTLASQIVHLAALEERVTCSVSALLSGRPFTTCP